MATRAAALRSRDLDRAFFTAVALALLASTLAGFAPTYFLRGLSGAAPLSPLVIVHGAANSAWIVLFPVKTSLISTGRPDRSDERRVGKECVRSCRTRGSSNQKKK